MFFIDLNKLRIIKDYHFQPYNIEISLDLGSAAAKILAQLKEACASLCADTPAIAASYSVDVVAGNITEEDFITLTNLTTIAFFETLTTSEGRSRERRLDIPEKMQGVHISAALLKRAINQKTKVDVFNLAINCGDFHYVLVDNQEDNNYE